MRRREDFTHVTRRGRRARRSALVVYYLPDTTSTDPARVGFVVGRVVGDSVRRHRVTRRLRHLMRDRLERLPIGSLLVVRALPGAADHTSARLAADLDAALHRLLPESAGVRP